MAFDERSLDDYIDVPQRIAEFREKHPDGALQPVDPKRPYRMERVKVTIQGEHGPEQVEKTFLVYAAAAYRSPDDPRPGIGCAWEEVPGRTPYTRNSELMNAETSAWGRAILAVLAADAKKGIATRNEVAASRAERDQQQPAARPAPPATPPQNRTEPDPACQALADLALQVKDLDALHQQVYLPTKAKGFLNHVVVNKSNGVELPLGQLIGERKTDFENDPANEKQSTEVKESA